MIRGGRALKIAVSGIAGGSDWLFIAYWRANIMPSTTSADEPDPESPSTFTGSI
jgi:hypothetical protein